MQREGPGMLLAGNLKDSLKFRVVYGSHPHLGERFAKVHPAVLTVARLILTHADAFTSARKTRPELRRNGEVQERKGGREGFPAQSKKTSSYLTPKLVVPQTPRRYMTRCIDG